MSDAEFIKYIIPTVFGIRITPFLMLAILGIIGLVYEYLKLKIELKHKKVSAWNYDLLIEEYKNFWKLPLYYIVFFSISHILAIIVL